MALGGKMKYIDKFDLRSVKTKCYFASLILKFKLEFKMPRALSLEKALGLLPLLSLLFIKRYQRKSCNDCGNYRYCAD